MTEYDLSFKMAPYLDKHMVFPLLEFHHQLGIYPENQIDECRLQLLEGSKMADFRMEIFQRLYPDKEIPEDMVSKRLEIVEQWNSMKKQMEPIVEILEKEEVKKQMQISRDSNQLMDFLVENFGFRVELLDVLYKFAKLYYEVGGYEETTLHLYLHNMLVPPSDPNFISSLWGKLASEILLKNWEAAVEDMNRLKEFIDGTSFSVDAMALTQRCWLIHWSLFVFFNMPKGYELLIDMFLYQANYLNTIQTMCPHVLRYLTTAVVITHQTRPQALKDLVKVIQQEAYSYRDPITEFIECLYVNFDFDGAQQKLKACQAVLANDFFTVACPSDFIDNARLMTFETFCRIHQVISIDMLAQKLNMERGKAERWIADLIRHAQLDAKIDSAQGHVLMGTLAVSPYQQLIEKTKNLSFRSQMLTQAIEKKINARAYEHGSWGVNV